MKKPNFFIVGAPKCGTTSLAAWLSEHPAIFISRIKEPHFFNFDDGNRNITTPDSYSKLFLDATPEHIAVGEASTWYLTSKVAIREILKYEPEAKFIVMLRNPVDLAYSLHQQNRYSAYEDIDDFAEAWRAQEARLNGQFVPATCREARCLQYGHACLLGKHLKNLIEIAGPDRVHWIFLEDLARDPGKEYQKVLKFLGAPAFKKDRFETRNAAKMYRSRLIQRFISLGSRLKYSMGVQRSLGLHKLNKKESPRKPLPEDVRLQLFDYFRSDIELLSELTGRSLDHWRPKQYLSHTAPIAQANEIPKQGQP